MQMQMTNDNIESMEEKLAFISAKQSDINTTLININPDEIEQLSFNAMTSVEGARATLQTFFGILLDVNVYKKQLEEKVIE